MDADGTKWWYRDGRQHREDGPAIERADGSKAWYRDGKPLSEAEGLQLIAAEKARRQAQAEQEQRAAVHAGLAKPLRVSKPLRLKKPGLLL